MTRENGAGERAGADAHVPGQLHGPPLILPEPEQLRAIEWRHRGLRFREAWAEESVGRHGADIVRYRSRSEPLTRASCSLFVTLCTDLSLDPGELFATLHETARYHVRRGLTRDAFVIDRCLQPEVSMFREFMAFHTDFATRRGLAPLDLSLFRAYLDAGRLLLSRAEGPDGRALVWHAHVLGPGMARFVAGASGYRSLDDTAARAVVGRANRSLHWDDMMALRSAGTRIYDWGGWYTGSHDDALAAINRFKAQFGGREASTYDCLVAGSTLGRVFLISRRLAGR